MNTYKKNGFASIVPYNSTVSSTFTWNLFTKKKLMQYCLKQIQVNQVKRWWKMLQDQMVMKKQLTKRKCFLVSFTIKQFLKRVTGKDMSSLFMKERNLLNVNFVNTYVPKKVVWVRTYRMDQQVCPVETPSGNPPWGVSTPKSGNPPACY